MSERQETVDDIVAEKRRRAEEIERDCAEKMKRGEMVSDCYARELVADIRREADRLEAAHKREHNRNFHRFATADEAAAAWHRHETKDTGDDFCEGCPFNLGEDCARGSVCSIGWLYAESPEGGTSK